MTQISLIELCPNFYWTNEHTGGIAMLIDPGNLSKGMGQMYIREFMETSTRTVYDGGWCLFRKGKDATHFFTLLQGEIILSIGGDDRKILKVQQAGDSFGWSSLVEGQSELYRNGCLYGPFRNPLF